MASTSYLPNSFAHELSRLQPILALVETEDTWQKIEKAIARIDAVTKAGAYKEDTYIPLLKEQACPCIVKALLSERTRLSGVAADFVMSAAPRLGARFDALVSTLIPPLLLCCARTNKVALARAKKCLLLIARHCKLPNMVPLMREAAHDKSVTLRLAGLEVTLTLMQSWRAQGSEELEHLAASRVHDIEDIIRATATDRDPEVRQISKRVFDTYSVAWPEKVDSFTAPLTPTSKRYLSLTAARPPVASSNTPRAAETIQKINRPPSRLQQERRPLEVVQPSRRNAELARSTAKTADRVDEKKAVTPRSLSSSTGRSVSQSSSASRHAPLTKADAPKPVAKQGAPKSTSQKAGASPAAPQSAPARERLHSSSPAPVPALNKQESDQRAALENDVARQSTATPSRAIAARLALERFDLRSRQRTHDADKQSIGRKEPSGSNRAALAAFAIAVSKKQSPRRMPLRVPLASARPVSAEASPVKVVQEEPRPIERVASPQSAQLRETAIFTTSAQEKMQDVFESRPLLIAEDAFGGESDVSPRLVGTSPSPMRSPRAFAKKTGSSFTKGLHARGQLLGSKGRNPAMTPSAQRRSAAHPKGDLTPRLFFAKPVETLEAEAIEAAVAIEAAPASATTPSKAPPQTASPMPVPCAFDAASQHMNSPARRPHAALPSSPMMLGVQSPLSSKTAAAAALVRSPPSVMLRQMAMTMLANRPAQSSPLAAARLQPPATACALSSPLKPKTILPDSPARPTKANTTHMSVYQALQRCKKI